jgi:hypothetical protein
LFDPFPRFAVRLTGQPRAWGNPVGELNPSDRNHFNL